MRAGYRHGIKSRAAKAASRLRALRKRRLSLSGQGASPASPRARGGVMGRSGVDLFIEDGAYTTLASAVAILAVLTLLFSSVTAVWSMSRAGDAQVAADAGALAGANVVSSYHTAATVVDASILSLGLAGFCTVGAGLVGMLVPGAHAAAAETVQAGVRIIKTRNEFAQSASEGLDKLEEALPYLVAARAVQVIGAQEGESSYTGAAVAVPRTSASDFSAIADSQISTDELEETSESLDAAASELERAAEKTAGCKERAWLADCGKEGMNMQERAGRLSGISAAENPDFASSVTWEPQVALDRARAYYRWRAAHEQPEGSDVEARAEAAARKAFYRFALGELERASISMEGDRLVSTVPLLPRNTAEVRETTLFTDAAWPVSSEGGTAYLHFGTDCPRYAQGSPGGLASVAAYEGAERCPSCDFGLSTLGRVPAASTSIDNGFEYHLRAFTEALDEYVDAKNEELELEEHARAEAEAAGSAFDEAIRALSGARPRIAPPGRNGVVAFAATGEEESPEELAASFTETAQLPARGAISAAVLAPDEATAENNVLARFFSTLEERSGGGVAGVLGDAMELWGKLLVGYGNIQGKLDELMDGLIGDLGVLGPIAQMLGDTVSGAVSALGLEPCDLRLRKPVLTDTAKVISSPGSDIAGLADTQEALRRIPIGASDPQAILQALGYEAEKTLAGATFTIAEIPLPGGGSIPLTVNLSTLVGALSCGGS